MGHYTIRTNDDEDQAIKGAGSDRTSISQQQNLYDGFIRLSASA